MRPERPRRKAGTACRAGPRSVLLRRRRWAIVGAEKGGLFDLQLFQLNGLAPPLKLIPDER